LQLQANSTEQNDTFTSHQLQCSNLCRSQPVPPSKAVSLTRNSLMPRGPKQNYRLQANAKSIRLKIQAVKFFRKIRRIAPSK